MKKLVAGNILQLATEYGIPASLLVISVRIAKLIEHTSSSCKLVSLVAVNIALKAWDSHMIDVDKHIDQMDIELDDYVDAEQKAFSAMQYCLPVFDFENVKEDSVFFSVALGEDVTFWVDAFLEDESLSELGNLHKWMQCVSRKKRLAYRKDGGCEECSEKVQGL